MVFFLKLKIKKNHFRFSNTTLNWNTFWHFLFKDFSKESIDQECAKLCHHAISSDFGASSSLCQPTLACCYALWCTKMQSVRHEAWRRSPKKTVPPLRCCCNPARHHVGRRRDETFSQTVQSAQTDADWSGGKKEFSEMFREWGERKDTVRRSLELPWEKFLSGWAARHWWWRELNCVVAWI